MSVLSEKKRRGISEKVNSYHEDIAIHTISANKQFIMERELRSIDFLIGVIESYTRRQPEADRPHPEALNEEIQ